MSSLKRFAAVLAILFVVTAMCIAQDTESGGETGGEGSGGAEADPSEAPALRMLNKNYINEDLKQGVKKGLKRLAELQESNRPEDPLDVRGSMWRLAHAVREAVRAYPDDPERRKAVADILADAQDRISKLDD